MYLGITVNHNKFVLASSVKALTDEANKFTDNANKNLFGLRTTYVDIITEFVLIPSTGNGFYCYYYYYYYCFILLLFFFFFALALRPNASHDLLILEVF